MACRISNLASLSLYSISGVYSSHHIFEVKGLNIEYSDIIAIFDIHNFQHTMELLLFGQKRPNRPNRKSGVAVEYSRFLEKRKRRRIFDINDQK